jgi:hypothetical protein
VAGEHEDRRRRVSQQRERSVLTGWCVDRLADVGDHGRAPVKSGDLELRGKRDPHEHAWPSSSATSVCLACFHSTGLKAGTPFEIASHRSSPCCPSQRVQGRTRTSARRHPPPVVAGNGTAPSDPVATRATPTVIGDMMHPMNT